MNGCPSSIPIPVASLIPEKEITKSGLNIKTSLISLRSSCDEAYPCIPPAKTSTLQPLSLSIISSHSVQFVTAVLYPQSLVLPPKTTIRFLTLVEFLSENFLNPVYPPYFRDTFLNIQNNNH